MDRRSVLFMTIAGLAAAPALAQSTASPQPMGDAEKTHIRDTLQVGGMSLELSKLALTHAMEPKVKEFANFETAEQETIGGILKPLLSGEPPVDPMQAEMVKKLQQAGKNFDRDYVDAEIQGHTKLLQIQNTYLASGKNETQIDVAKLAKGMINEHLALLSDMQKNGVHG
jgi:predicted outer membrane protein